MIRECVFEARKKKILKTIVVYNAHSISHINIIFYKIINLL